MNASEVSTVSSFVQSVPPGELADVVASIRSLRPGSSEYLEAARPAFQKYTEEQLTTTKLPGGSQEVIISEANKLDNGRYYDTESQTSFAFDHVTQKASEPKSFVVETQQADLMESLRRGLASNAKEHYPDAAFGVYPTDNDTTFTICLVSNKYSPNNFWNGRWRSTFVYSPLEAKVLGVVNVDIHYYEDGNVRLSAVRSVEIGFTPSASGSDVMKGLAAAEQKLHEGLNQEFSSLSEGVFKGLRRQLPVTRQKVEWDKIGSYRLGQDIGGGRTR
ncbi:MAG: F-actin-capping protein subunit alpha [Lichina confinis]|nr:MAG: F-actin-capping protein subunit alpha [Lichina confinis]